MLYLAPFEGTGSSLDPFRAKHSRGARYGGIRSSRQATLAFVEMADQAQIDEILNDPETFVLGARLDEQHTDGARVAATLERLGIPGDFVTDHGFLTWRQIAWYIAACSLMPQRFEAIHGKSSREAILSRGAGQNDDARLKSTLDQPWEDLPTALRDEYVAAWESLQRRQDYNTKFAGLPYRRVLREIAFTFDDIFIGGLSLGVPLAQNITREFAYGDNRQEQATDGFDAGIGGDWANGEGVYGTWTGTGVIEPTNVLETARLRYDTTAPADEQYTTVTVQTLSGTDLNALSAVCRQQSGTNEAAYDGGVQSDTGGADAKYVIQEWDSDGNSTNLATTGTPGALSAGETITFEAEGTALRLGTDEGAGDTERTSATDATLGSGDWGISGFALSTEARCQVTAWAGGNIVAPSLSVVPSIVQNYRNMGVP